MLGTLALGLTAYQGMVSVKEEDDDSDNHLLKRPSKKPKKAVTQSKPVSGKAGTHQKSQSASTVRYTTSRDGIHTHVNCPQLAAFTPRPCARSLHSPLPPRSRSLRKRRLPPLATRTTALVRRQHAAMSLCTCEVISFLAYSTSKTYPPKS